MTVLIVAATSVPVQAKTRHVVTCPRSVPAPNITGVGGDSVWVSGMSCRSGYALVRAWFFAAPHNKIVRGFHFSAHNFVVTGRKGTVVVRFRLYGTD